MQCRATYSTSENRNPMQLRGPPRNVIMWPQTPGIVFDTGVADSQRSGLAEVSEIEQTRATESTHLNSMASGPQICTSRFRHRIGMKIGSPLRILEIR